MNKKNRDLLLAAVVIVLIGWLIMQYAFKGNEQAPTTTSPQAQEKVMGQ